MKFFLQALVESAKDATAAIDELIALHDKNIGIVAGMGRASKNAMLVFHYLESNPIIEIGKNSGSIGNFLRDRFQCGRKACLCGNFDTDHNQQKKQNLCL